MLLLARIVPRKCGFKIYCLELSKNLVFHDKSKHIKIKFHYIRNMVERGVMMLQYVAIEEQIVNVTCPNLQNNFMFLRNIMLYFMLEFVINDQVGSRII